MNCRSALPFIFLFLLSGPLFAQDGDPKAYDFPSQLPSALEVHPKGLYDSIRSVRGLAPDSIPSEQVDKFAAQQSYGLKALFQNGSVYAGWTEMQSYLNQVLQRALPEDKPMKTMMKVYPSTSTGWNARVFYDGTILVDVGFIADMGSEAELAFVLAHEAAHFYEEDVKERFFRQVDERTRRIRKRGGKLEKVSDALASAAYSRADERKADSLAATYVDASGYRLADGIDCFQRLKDHKTLYKKADSVDEKILSSGGDDEQETKSSIKGLFSTHPDLGDRVDELRRLRYELQNEGASEFLGEDRFLRMRRKARRETVRLLLQRGEYEEGMMRGFKYHLLHPEDPYIREYLIKSLRRRLFIDPNKAEKGFLNWVQHRHKGDSVSVLSELNHLIRDSSRYQKIEAERYLRDSNKVFRTYGEALAHFSKEALSDGAPYAYLIKVIDHHLNSRYAKRDSFIEKYLGQSDTSLAPFVRALRKGDLSKKPSGGKALMLVNRTRMVEDRRYGFRRRYLKEDERSRTLIKELKALLDEEFSSDIQVAYLPKYRKTNLSKAIKAQRIRKLILQYPEKLFGETIDDRDRMSEDRLEEIIEEHKEKKEGKRDSTFFMLAPEYWSFFQKNRISSLEFLFSVGFDDRVKRMKSIYDIFNPWVYLSAPWRFSAAYRTGSGRFYMQVGDIRYAPFSKERLKYHLEAYPYKMTKNNFLNAAYYAIGSTRGKD